MSPRESNKRRRERALIVSRHLAQDYPDVTCALIHQNPFELLVATVLSAQCTDKKVNEVTPELFARWPTPALMGEADGTLEEVVHATGFFRQKAKNLRGLSRRLTEHHGGQVPKTMDELVQLPGVARKTANVVLGTAFGIAVGIVVDTHVKRLCHRRLKLVSKDDPVVVERELMELLAPEEWVNYSHRMIWHGRLVCDAKKPACDRCTMIEVCPSAFNTDDRPAKPKKTKR